MLRSTLIILMLYGNTASRSCVRNSVIEHTLERKRGMKGLHLMSDTFENIPLARVYTRHATRWNCRRDGNKCNILRPRQPKSK